MNFGLAVTVSVEIRDKAFSIQSLSDDLEAYFKNRTYGSDINERFKRTDEEETRKLLAKEILVYLVVFEKVKSKIKDFDVDSFKADLEEYFKNRSLI